MPDTTLKLNFDQKLFGELQAQATDIIVRDEHGGEAIHFVRSSPVPMTAGHKWSSTFVRASPIPHKWATTWRGEPIR